MNNTSVVGATNVTVVDQLPEGLVYVDSTKSGEGIDFTISGDERTLTWVISEMGNDPVELFVTVRTALTGDLTNNVTVSSKENDTPVNDNETVHVVPTNLTVVKTANATAVLLGDLVEFTMNVTNNGLVKANNVNVTDILDSAFEVQSIGNETYLKYNDDQKIVWTIPSLDGGNSATLSIIVKLVKEGTYTNVVTVNCDENTTEVSNETNVTSLPVVDLKINKTVDKVNVTVGDEVTYTITVTNLGPCVATNVIVTENMSSNVEITDVDTHNVGEYINGIWYVGTLNKDDIVKMTLTVKTLAVGIVENIVSVNSTQKDNDTSDNVYPCENVTVNPAPSLVNGVNVTYLYGDPILVDYNSTNATGVNYEIYDKDNNMVYNGTTAPKGTVNVTKQLPVGNYTVYWANTVDENHIPATNTSTIEILPIPTETVVGNVTTYPGENVTIPVNVTADDDEPFNGNVTVTLPDGTNQTVEIINGTGNATWETPDDYLPGDYPDNATFPGDENYLPSNGTGIVTILPIPTHVTIGNVTAYPGENVTIPINVTVFDDKPFNGNVSVVMPDNSTHIISVENGTGIIIWHVPEDYSPDRYPDSIRFPGNDQYLPSNGTGIVEVVKIPTHITVGNVTTFAGREVTIPINVTADDGKPFNGIVTITFPDGSKKPVVIVNGQGTTTWFVPSDYAPDKYPDSVKFDGDDKYLPSEGKGTITVIKIPVDIIVGNVTCKPGDNVRIPIHVIPRDGSVFNGKVTVELPDGTVKIIDIVNGKGFVNWKVPDNYKGVYPVKASSNETEVYYPANGTGFITVIPDVPPVPPVPPQPPVPENDTEVPQKDTVKQAEKTGLAKYETGNPIFALLMVLSLLGVGIRRRK